MQYRDDTETLALCARYHDALYRGDAELLGSLFHEKALYAATTDGDIRFWSMDHYLPIVAHRPSPASRGEAPDGRVIAITFAGPNAALAQVQSSIGERFFTDFLSLVKVEDTWLIAAKVFDYVTRPAD
ncbi:nuclear transport factor 2 family protein [Stappia sp. ES.058]|uniref:nuclear transport factor 2 family protein n=1 Tax=Stappia sp. ES.058 TaxID=1881061 RepID=UPI00087BB2A3|nr:nuclear transport factor 2 family protein [Stappia sp. ES.058]SDU00027.1 Putative lumazine-binding [Stappia sp. ES.058]